MSQIITAIVEGGRLRPTEPLDLAEGAEVKVMILPAAPEPPKKPRSPEEIRAIIAQIAAMPEEGDPKDGLSGRDHDRILYGEGGAR